jgi:hypothetical protein
MTQAIQTPLGTFPNMKRAMAAHHCTRRRLEIMMEQQPDQYRLVPPPPARPRIQRHQPLVRGVRWPIAWAQYRFQDDEVKQAIYELWCREQGWHPEAEGAGDAFFDAMDITDTDTDTPTEDDPDESGHD